MTTITHVSAMTATTTAKMTQVPTTRCATMNAPKYQLGKCKATQAQHKMMSPSILHPTNTTANNATPRNLFLFLLITIQQFAISLQLIVASTGRCHKPPNHGIGGILIPAKMARLAKN
jgi:hypothetical protein